MPHAAQVDTVNVERTTANTVVVPDKVKRWGPTKELTRPPPGTLALIRISLSAPGVVTSKVPVVVERLDIQFVILVVPPKLKAALRKTSQSPAGSEMLVRLVATPVVKAIAEPVATELEINSPTKPLEALSLVVVPEIP